MPSVRGATPSHSCDKRSVSCLPSDCISVSMHSALLIVRNHGFVSGALTHTSLHAHFRSAAPHPPHAHTHTSHPLAPPSPPPPNHLPSPAPLSCARLAPNGIAVRVKRPGSLCLTTCVFVRRDANVSPLILFCHLMVTPASAPLRARRSAVAPRPGISLNLSPQDIFNTCPSCYLRAIVRRTNPFSALFVPR